MTKPVAVLKTLEDSPPWVDRELISAYLRTTYRIPALGLDHGIGRLDTAERAYLEQGGVARFAFVTAWNPRSEKLTIEENRRRNLRLAAELGRIGVVFYPALHVALDADWPDEESFYAVNISLENAIGLARQFDQNAIVCWEKGDVPALWLVNFSM